MYCRYRRCARHRTKADSRPDTSLAFFLRLLRLHRHFTVTWIPLILQALPPPEGFILTYTPCPRSPSPPPPAAIRLAIKQNTSGSPRPSNAHSTRERALSVGVYPLDSTLAFSFPQSRRCWLSPKCQPRNDSVGAESVSLPRRPAGDRHRAFPRPCLCRRRPLDRTPVLQWKPRRGFKR